MQKTIAVGNTFIELESGLHCKVREIQLVNNDEFHIVLRFKDNTEIVRLFQKWNNLRDTFLI